VTSQFPDGHARQILRVHPVELVCIENGIPAADLLEREAVDQLLPRHQLPIVAR
jgi:hypothetical protein